MMMATYQSMDAQPAGFPENCTSVNLVYACSGLPAGVLAGTTVVTKCGNNFQQYPVNSQGVANLGETVSCRMKDSYICLDAGGWEICEYLGNCTYSVEQTLEVEPFINGEAIGFGAGVGSSGAIVPCRGKVYNEFVNNQFSVEDILICPGDNVKLEFPYGNFSLPATSGMCLFVEVKSIFGQVLASDVYNSSDEFNGQINIASVFTNLNTDDNYILTMRLGCCSGNDGSCFSVESTRSAYIHLSGQFDYDLNAVASDGFNGPQQSFSPPSTPTGTQLNDASDLLIAFYATNIVNPSGDPYSYELFEVDCTDPTQGGALLGSGNSFDFLGVLPNTSTCKCFRLDLTYNNNCQVQDVTDSYYFKKGPNCPESSPSNMIGNPNNGLSDVIDKVQLIQNPVQDELTFKWNQMEEERFELSIFDVGGQLILQQTVLTSAQELVLPFSQQSGTYFYHIQMTGEVISGKIIKQ